MAVKRTTNSDAWRHVAAKEDFQGSNLKGVWQGHVYVVYSYDTPIVVYSDVTWRWFQTMEKFSVTTSKQQSQLGHALPSTTRWVRQDDLLNVIDKPDYIPATELERAGLQVGDLCRVTRSGALKKGSVVRVAEDPGTPELVYVEEVIAERSPKWHSWDGRTFTRIKYLEKINGATNG